MGVLNATPDSFYAGSRAVEPAVALGLAEAMIRDGADVLDIGGESTRPGAEPVSTAEELARCTSENFFRLFTKVARPQ